MPVHGNYRELKLYELSYVVLPGTLFVRIRILLYKDPCSHQHPKCDGALGRTRRPAIKIPDLHMSKFDDEKLRRVTSPTGIIPREVKFLKQGRMRWDILCQGKAD
jgi:hypothetical protein